MVNPVTPLSALKKLEPHRQLITITGVVFLALLVILLLLKVSVAIIIAAAVLVVVDSLSTKQIKVMPNA